MSKNDMVMVPRELLERLKNASSYLGTHIEASEGIKTSHYANADAAREILAKPAQQNQGEAQALLREVVDAFKLEPDGSCINPGREFIRPWSAKLAALSASAEPSAPACLTCKGSGLEYDSGAAHPCTDCKSSAPVEIDERAENSERYLWLKENVTGGSLGIPGGWIDDETEHWDRIIDTERKP